MNDLNTPSPSTRAPQRRTFVLVLVALITTLAALSSSAALHRGPFAALQAVRIEKAVLATGDHEPLSADLMARLQPWAVEYDSFVVSYLSQGQLHALGRAAAAQGHEISVVLHDEHRQSVPSHRFDATDDAKRHGPWNDSLITRPIPGLFTIRFGYPIKESWLNALASCGASEIATLGATSRLVAAPNLGTILSCEGVANRLEWVDHYYSTDRARREILSSGLAEFSVTALPGTDAKSLFESVAGEVEVLEWNADEGLATGVIRADAVALEDLLSNSDDLVSARRRYRSLGIAGERQAQVLAANYDPKGIPWPGYDSWLQDRNLDGPINQATVAVFDTGLDRADLEKGENPHPALGDRVIAGRDVIHDSSVTWEDRTGHGTLVAGIISSDGTPVDGDGFAYAQGIAPGAALIGIKMFNLDESCTDFEIPANIQFAASDGLTFSYFQGARIANNSWREVDEIDGSSVTGYTDLSQAYERFVEDATFIAGQHPMTIVFAAGNEGDDDSITPPGNAKNVITVGSTDNYHPFSSPFCGGDEPDDIHRVSDTSSRGPHFGPAPGKALAHNTRIKPDIVAPGRRVHGTVPYQSSDYVCSLNCRDYDPQPGPGEDGETSFSGGTSFAAPAGSGAAALKTKWFLDRGVTPKPTLLKAALIATAQSLGPANTACAPVCPPVSCTDCRPSNDYGWGRIDLDRLTDDSVERWWINETESVATGETDVFDLPLVVSDQLDELLIVLVWNDDQGQPQHDGSLLDDLDLVVEERLLFNGALVRRLYGNQFNENNTGIDDGYSYPQNGPTETDTANNVEAVFLPGGSLNVAGTWIRIKVTGASMSGSNAESYSIYAYNLRTGLGGPGFPPNSLVERTPAPQPGHSPIKQDSFATAERKEMK